MACIRLIVCLLILLSLSACRPAMQSTPPAGAAEAAHPLTKAILLNQPPEHYFVEQGLGPLGDDLGTESLLVFAATHAQTRVLYRDARQTPEEYDRLTRFIQPSQNHSKFIEKMIFPYYHPGLDPVGMHMDGQACIQTAHGPYPVYQVRMDGPEKDRSKLALFTALEYPHQQLHFRHRVIFLNFEGKLHKTGVFSPHALQVQYGALGDQFATFINQSDLIQRQPPLQDASIRKWLLTTACAS